MLDYIKRILIAGIVALCISLLFLGGRQAGRQESINIEEVTSEWIWPADGVITDTYGTRNGSHKGIDIAGAPGTPVYAVDGGKVTKSYYSSTYGHVVFVEHPNQLETVYAHLQEKIRARRPDCSKRRYHRRNGQHRRFFGKPSSF